MVPNLSRFASALYQGGSEVHLTSCHGMPPSLWNSVGFPERESFRSHFPCGNFAIECSAPAWLIPSLPTQLARWRRR